MLYILLSTVLILPVLWGLGDVFCKIFRMEVPGIAMKIFLAIFGITIVLTAVAFFFPLNFWVEVLTISIGLVLFFWQKGFLDFWNFFLQQRRSFYCYGAFILFFGSFYPFILDHFGYYIPTIKWITEYGLVKGISNLDLLLGQMSGWHIFQAGFSHFSDPFLRINSIVLLVYLIWIYEKKSWIHLLFLPVLFLFSQSPNTDLPVMVFSLMLLQEMVARNPNAALLFAFSVFVFFIKPTMIWLPLLCFLYSVFILKGGFKFMLPGFFILLLFFIKNIWTLGFPVFPVQFPDFGIGWKPNAQLLQNSADMAVLKSYDLQYTIAEIRGFSGFERIKNWLFLPGIKGWVNSLFIVSLTVFLVFTIRKKSMLITLVFISVMVKSVLVLLFSAQYRFFSDVFLVVFFIIFLDRVSAIYSRLFFVGASVLLAVAFSFPVVFRTVLPDFRAGGFMAGFYTEQFLYPSAYQWHKYHQYQIGNLAFNVVNGYQYSFDTPIPAISPGFLKEDLDAGIFPQLKTQSLKDGFIWRKMDAAQKAQLQQILHEYLQSFPQNP